MLRPQDTATRERTSLTGLWRFRLVDGAGEVLDSYHATTSGTMRVGGNKKGMLTRDRQPKVAAHALRRRWRKNV